jgi:hypothetical protein
MKKIRKDIIIRKLLTKSPRAEDILLLSRDA